MPNQQVDRGERGEKVENRRSQQRKNTANKYNAKTHLINSTKLAKKRQKNSGKTLNISKKFLPTVPKLETNLKSPKGHLHLPNSTTRPTLRSQARCQQSKKFLFRFNFKTKMNQSKLKNKKSDNFYWSRNGEQLCSCALVGPSIPHKPIRGCQIVGITRTTCVSGLEIVRYLGKHPMKFHMSYQAAIPLA